MLPDEATPTSPPPPLIVPLLVTFTESAILKILFDDKCPTTPPKPHDSCVAVMFDTVISASLTCR